MCQDDPYGRGVEGVDLQPLNRGNHRFECRWGHGSISLVSVVCWVLGGIHNASVCHSEQFYGVCVIICDIEISAMRHPRPNIGCCATERYTHQNDTIFIFHYYLAHFNQKKILFLLLHFSITCFFFFFFFFFFFVFLSIFNLSVVYIVEKFHSVYFQKSLFNFMAT